MSLCGGHVLHAVAHLVVVHVVEEGVDDLHVGPQRDGDDEIREYLVVVDDRPAQEHVDVEYVLGLDDGVLDHQLDVLQEHVVVLVEVPLVVDLLRDPRVVQQVVNVHYALDPRVQHHHLGHDDHVDLQVQVLDHLQVEHAVDHRAPERHAGILHGDLCDDQGRQVPHLREQALGEQRVHHQLPELLEVEDVALLDLDLIIIITHRIPHISGDLP